MNRPVCNFLAIMLFPHAQGCGPLFFHNMLKKSPTIQATSQVSLVSTGPYCPLLKGCLGMPNNTIARRTPTQAHMYMAQMLAINKTHVVRTVQKNLFESFNYFFCMSHKPYLISK